MISSSSESGCDTLKISVITVCFNSEATIGHTIQSVNQQTYLNIEHVFIDGASKDNTLAIIEHESRVDRVVVSEPDKGIYDALNKGIKAATGDVIGFLHADDFYANPNVLEKITRSFSSPDIAAVYGDLQYISQSERAKVLRHWQTLEFSPRRLRCGWMPPHPTLYVRKPWYDRIGGFDTGYRIAADYFFMLQLFGDLEIQTAYIPEVLVKMRVGGESNRSLKNIFRKSKEDLHALRRSGVGGIATLLGKNFRKVGQFW